MGRKPQTQTEIENSVVLTENEASRLQALLENTKQKQTMDQLLRTVLHAGLKAIEKRRKERDEREPSEAQIAKAQAILAKAGKAA